MLFVQHVNRAMQVYRLDNRYRLHIALAMANLLKSGLEVRTDDRTMDRVHEIASSASPWLPAVLVLRAEYLINAQRCGPELDRIVDYLKRRVTMQAASGQVWRYYHEESACGSARPLGGSGAR